MADKSYFTAGEGETLLRTDDDRIVHQQGKTIPSRACARFLMDQLKAMIARL